MKRLLIVLLGNLLSFFHLYAGDTISVNPFVTLEINENEYVVEFTSPYCEERDTTINVGGHDYTFSHILFGEDAETISRIYDTKELDVLDINDVFDYMEGDGIPELPFISLELQLPENAEIDVKVTDIQYFNLNTGRSSAKKVPHTLRHDYLPSQSYSESELPTELQYDNNAYSDSVSNTLYRCSEQGGYLGTNGFTFSLSPILYTPSKQSIVPIAHAKYTISVTADNNLKRTIDTYAIDRSSSVSPEILSFYDNHRETTNRSISRANLGTYLIITTSKYVSTLAPFITHKQNLGYNVTVKTFTAGTSSTTIRNYLIGLGTQSSGFPKYTLIVGSYSEIPYSYGIWNDPKDPPTDIYYACLEKSDISKEKNFKPETILGRWPVTTTSNLTNVINKTIAAENKTSFSRRFFLCSDIGSGEATFASDIKKAYNKLLEIPNASALMLDARDGFTYVEIRNEFSHYDDLLFVFRGHGDSLRLGNAFYNGINAYSIPSSQPYFTIGLACYLNHPRNNTFGNNWINQGDVACGIYAATTESDRASNTYLSKHIFNYLLDQEANLSWGGWLSSAAAKYYSSLINASRRRETEKYVILGDPSLYIFGINQSTGSPLPYKASKRIEKTSNSIITGISLDETIKNIVIFSSTGKMIDNINVTNQSLSNEMLTNMLQSLQRGIYIICFTTDKTQYTHKIHIQ